MTKSGVDILDKLARGYSSKRKYRRWPCHVFFTLLDCGIYVAYMMQKMTGDSQDTQHSFKKELAYELALPLVRQRSRVTSLHNPTVKEAMKAVGIKVDIEITHRQPIGQSRCAFCHTGSRKLVAHPFV